MLLNKGRNKINEKASCYLIVLNSMDGFESRCLGLNQTIRLIMALLRSVS